MPDINKVLDKGRRKLMLDSAATRIESTTTRPWDDLEFDNQDDPRTIQGRYYEEKVTPARPAPAQAPETAVVPWYGSAKGIGEALTRHGWYLLKVFAVAATVFAGGATLMPSSYFSTLHLFAPEKTDSISTRLQMFSNKIEFASFPVDFKIPLRLVARRLSSPEADAWVIAKYKEEQKKDPSLPDLVESKVAAETFYAEGSELLVIQGYAHDPGLAAHLTMLYWDYLEQLITVMRKDNLVEINRWIELTSEDWNQRLEDISKRILDLPATALIQGDQMKGLVASKLSEVELRKRTIDRALHDMKAALKSGNDSQLLSVPDSEFRELARIDAAFVRQFGADSKQHQDLLQRARETAEAKVSELGAQSKVAADELSEIHQQLLEYSMANKTLSTLSSRQAELVRQQSEYVSKLEELQKLKDQVEVESSLAHTKLRPIQLPTADKTTRRPLLIVKYSVSTFLALLLTVFALWRAQASSERKAFRTA